MIKRKVIKIEILHNPTFKPAWRGVVTYRNEYGSWFQNLLYSSDSWMRHTEAHTQEECATKAKDIAAHIEADNWTTVKEEWTI